ncbi:PREDICTED: ATP-dependent DNA helicase PIF4-like, partial [Camelina sativa]
MDFNDMPKPDLKVLKELGNSLWQQEQQYNVKEEEAEHHRLFNQLNKEQEKVYKAVLESIYNNMGKLFFLYGPGGTGKTFVYKTIISKLRSEKRIVLPVASSGIAALLLPGGRTAHSRFKIPLIVTEDSICDIKKGTMLAELLIKTDLIIWDEAPMSHRHTFEALDRTLRDLLSTEDCLACEKPFGGKTVLLGGDFRQILPVIRHGTRADTVLASISHSYVWNSCKVFMLETNMRLHHSETRFDAWLLTIGNGTAPTFETDDGIDEDDGEVVQVHHSFFLKPKGHELQQIIEAAYPQQQSSHTTLQYLTERAILTPRNEYVDEINAYMLAQVSGEVKEYLSSDSIGKADTVGEDYEAQYP